MNKSKYYLHCLILFFYFFSYLLDSLASTYSLSSSDFEPVQIKITRQHDNNHIIDFYIKEGWQLYAYDSDYGHPLTINLTNQQNQEIDFDILWPKSKSKKNHHFNEEDDNIAVKIYESKISIPIAIKSHNDDKIKLQISYAACGDQCLVKNQEFNLSLANLPDHFFSYQTFIMLILAILGGIILNFMPCVLPVISIKILHFVKYATLNRKKIIIHFLMISLGVLLFFLFLALITISLRQIGITIGWGRHFQEPIILSLIIGILLFLSGNMMGFYEINLPQLMSNKIIKTSTSFEYLNSLLFGLFVSILATPCTAPFLGTAITFAMTQSNTIIIMIYFGIALGMSLPYIMISLLPQTIKLLPKPGKWMNKLRKIMSIPIIATVCWFSYILFQQTSYQGAIILLAILAIIYSLFWMKKNRLFYPLLISSFIILLSNFYYLELDPNSDFNEITQKVTEARRRDQTVLIYITADWCLTCKTNEKLVLNNEKIKTFIKEHDVLLVKADYTRRSSEISQYLSEHKRYGIPFVVVYGPSMDEGIILPEMLSEKTLIEAINKVRNKS